MQIAEFINIMPIDRQAILTAIHELILAHDKSVTPIVKPMMGKEMILYEEPGHIMKYALASTQKHMSLHCLPMYMNAPLYQKFEKLLPDAKFQKGCINFKDGSEVPSSVLAQLIDDCSAINITALLEKRKKK